MAEFTFTRPTVYRGRIYKAGDTSEVSDQEFEALSKRFKVEPPEQPTEQQVLFPSMSSPVQSLAPLLEPTGIPVEDIRDSDREKTVEQGAQKLAAQLDPGLSVTAEPAKEKAAPAAAPKAKGEDAKPNVSDK
jgi:hypothetical protein